MEDWETAAEELGLEVTKRTFVGKKPKRMAGVVDGHPVEIFHETVGDEMSSTTFTVVQVGLPVPIGPPGFRVKYMGGLSSAVAGPIRERMGWQVFETGGRWRVGAKADDPDRLSLWMTPERVDALAAIPGEAGAVVKPELLRNRLDQQASSEELVGEAHRLITLARRLE